MASPKVPSKGAALLPTKAPPDPPNQMRNLRVNQPLTTDSSAESMHSSISTKSMKLKDTGIGMLSPTRSAYDNRSVGDSSQNRVLELQNYVVNKIELMKRTQANTRKATQLAAFIPDYILNEESSRKIPYQSSTDAVVLMADVSGFTALTEAYSLKGKGGTDQLTKTLMNYIGPLAECILRADGDIVKYAGDAFLAFWRTNPDDYPEDVQRVIDCALYIQEKYGSHICKEVDITIKVKIGIGAGLTHLCWIGNDNYQHYICFGPGVEGASEGEKHCISGEVVLHPSTWQYCGPSNYKSTIRDETFHVVTEILNFVNPEKRGRPQGQRTRRKSAVPEKRTSTGYVDEQIRPQIADSIQTKTEEFLRRFIIPPVLRKLDDDIPLDYLNESRVVCICFIHIETVQISHEGVAFRETMTQIVNKAFVKIHENVTKMQGALTKVIMFDKGLTYLVVFGLPGYINENQCAHALKFSYRIRRSLQAIRLIDEVSIGVTSGSCYSGVLGHPRRQEYTVIGRKVNKAARLMVYYPGRVTCDQDTAYHSKLPSENFDLQEYKELKGIANPGKIYEFKNSESSEDQTVTHFPYPILGREPEMKYFQDVLFKARREFSDHIKVTNMSTKSNTTSGPLTTGLLGKETAVAKGIWMIIFEGENGIGKSRMLSACVMEADRQNVRVFSVAMTLILSGQSLYGLSSLVLEAIGMSDLRTTQEREDYLRKRVTDPELALELCVLNEIVHTKYPLNPKYTALDVQASHVYGQHVLSTLLRVMFPDEIILFVIDDAHLLDALSWEYIAYLSRTPNVFTICSLRRNTAGSPRIPENVIRMLYHNKNIKVVRLNGLDTKHCLALACQILEVKAIPLDVEKILVAKSQGVPAWCEQVLNELLRVGVLKLLPFSTNTRKTPMLTVDSQWIQKIKSSKKRTQNLWVRHDHDPDEVFEGDLSSRSSESISTISKKPSMADFSSLAEKESSLDPNQRMIVVKSDTNILHVKISGTLQEILVDSFDELNSTEQIILKCASVLGRKFSRKMLTIILPDDVKTAKKYEIGFHHLMEARHIRCASGTASKLKDQTAGAVTTPECYCRYDPFEDAFTEDPVPSKMKVLDRPKYKSCKFMEFVKESFIEVIYDLIVEDKRKDYHLNAAKYLDSNIVRCESCGGGSSAYMFGIVLKTGDLGVLDNEDSLRAAAAASARRKSSAPKGDPAGPDPIPQNNSKRKASLTTKIEGLKKTFHNSGAKVGQIELDILQELRQVEAEKEWKWGCCNKSASKERDQLELQEEMHGLRNAEDDKLINLKASGDEPTTNNTSIDNQPNSERADGSGENRSSKTVDLRLCECAALQAKLCIEMVKHYREAQKYGKCLVNLLDAAESVITIGNGAQALIHIEDAMGLMRAISTGKLPPPDKDDQDDARIDSDDSEGKIEYLSGLAYFEIGVNTKARDFFIKALARLGLLITAEENHVTKGASILRAKSKLWRTHNFRCCHTTSQHNTTSQQNSEETTKKITILSYLHMLFKLEKKLEMALLVTLWQVITAEEHGNLMQDVVPSYCNMMEIYAALSQHADAERYEKLSLTLIQDEFCSNEQIEPIELLTTATLFYTMSTIRLDRGSISNSVDAAFMSLRISQTVHDNALTIKILPKLIQSNLLSLRIPEVIEALQKLWYTSEEDDDWCGVVTYYSMCLDLLLNTAYPLEHFSACENFVINNDWTAENNMFHDYELQFNMETSLALWYARYSRWEGSLKWITEAESHRPKIPSFLTIAAELKLLQTHLIFVNHYLECKRYQHFAKARNAAKELMRLLTKSIKVVPVLKPRFLHLLAYYYRIRSRDVEAEKQLKAAEKLAGEHGNRLEQEWIVHNRTVWSEMAIPTIKYFWLEHTESHTLDWHSSGKIPWANIMYSLPLPAWK